jgi:hypothetical protein
MVINKQTDVITMIEIIVFDLFQLVLPLVLRAKNRKPEYDFSQAKRGAIIPQTGKTRITIYIDGDVLENFENGITLSVKAIKL